jgi:hypothetical protein
MTRRGRRNAGQTLVLFAVGMIAIIGMVGLIIDGGNAYAQQRSAQNGTDSAAEAGASMLARGIMAAAAGAGTPTSSALDAAVLAAANRSATGHGLQAFDVGTAGNSAAFYTDILGNLLTPAGIVTATEASAAQVGSGSVPSCSTNCVAGRAAGVAAHGQKTFPTLIARTIGLAAFTAGARATAVEGYAPPTGCAALQGCALLPITFATLQGSCDGSNKVSFGTTPWPFPVAAPYVGSTTGGPDNESILSICQDGSGAFGWLDFGCGTLVSQIQTPCNASIDFPTWVQAQPGNPNNAGSAINAYAGTIVGTYEDGLDQVVYIPFFDGICIARNKPADTVLPLTTTYPGLCPGSGSGGGNNTYFHVTYFLSFAVDHAYVQGGNNAECNSAPGTPISGGNGGTGCLKGWGVDVSQGPGTVTTTPGAGGPGTPLRIQLIK